MQHHRRPLDAIVGLEDCNYLHITHCKSNYITHDSATKVVCLITYYFRYSVVNANKDSFKQLRILLLLYGLLWMYYKSWIPDRKWRPFSPIRITLMAQTAKWFLASDLLPGVFGPLNMHSSVSPAGEFPLSHRFLNCFFSSRKVLQIYNLHGLNIHNRKSHN